MNNKVTEIKHNKGVENDTHYLFEKKVGKIMCPEKVERATKTLLKSLAAYHQVEKA